MNNNDVLLCSKGVCPRCAQASMTTNRDGKPYPLPAVTKEFREFNLKGIGGPVTWHIYSCTNCNYQAGLGEPLAVEAA